MENRNLLQKFIMPYFANMTVFPVILTCMVLIVSSSYGADIPVTIDVGTSTSTANYAVASGIPFPLGTVSDPTTLRMLDSNSNPVPCQFTPMVNWPDGSIKVAKATFYPAVSGSGYSPYAVRFQNASSMTNPSVTNPITVTNNGTQHVVNTGAATFYINNSTFTVFDQVQINGVNQMASPGDIVFIDDLTGNTFRTSLATNYTLTQTETGPISTTFLATSRAQAVGTGANQFGENTLVTVKLWMTFYANSGRVDLKYTWIDDVPRYNSNNYWGGVGIPPYVELNSNHIDLPLIPSPSTYTFGGNGTNYTGTVSGTNYLLQDAIVTSSVCPANPQGNGYDYIFNYSGVGAQTATGGLNGGIQLPADLVGGRAPGWMDVTNGTTGIMAGIKDFWQNFPNELSITSAGLMQIYVQPPASSNIMYTIAPGVAKTHDIYLDFHADTNTTAASQRFLLFQEHPIINAGAPWYAQTKVFGPISAPDSNSVIWDAQVDTFAACAQNRIGCSYYIRPYGKRNYGDYIGSNSTGGGYLFYDQHYEDAHGWILQYLRLGRKSYFNFSEAFVKHHDDLDVMHVGWPGYADNLNTPGMIHWHGGGDHEVSGVESGHIVPGGIDEYYLLTGDPRALDVSIEQGNWCLAYVEGGGSRTVPEFTGDTVRGFEYERAQAWALYTLLKSYESTNNIAYFNAATITIRNSIDWWQYEKQPMVIFAPGAQPPANLTAGSNTFVLPSNNWRWFFNPNYIITGAGIPTGTTISSLVADPVAKTTTITMSNAATATGANVTLTISPNIVQNVTPVTNPPSAATLADIQSQALYYETMDYTKGNGYYLTTFQTDNTIQTNLPETSDPASWVYQNHVPIAWMGAYFNSAIIRYLEWLYVVTGSRSTASYTENSISYRASDPTYTGAQPPTITVNVPTIKEMLVQTTNVWATHNFMGSGQYASVMPWMSQYSNNLLAYSITPEHVLANPTSADGSAEMPWVLLYIASNFQPTDLLFPNLWNGNTTTLTPSWAALQAKFQAISTLLFNYNATGFSLANNTGYDGAPVLWNMPYAMSLGTSTSLVNGSCGAANTGTFSTIPTINLCVNGTATGVTGTGPWSWTCVGYNGGTTASCSAAYSSTSPSGSGGGSSGGGGGTTTTTGVCGSANGSELLSAPTTNLCSVGIASLVSGYGPWNWTCTGTDNNDILCSAYVADTNAFTFSCTSADVNPIGTPWVVDAGRTPLQIASNLCTDTNDSAGSAMYNNQVFSQDQYSRITFGASAAACGVSLRTNPATNSGYMILTDGTNADVLRVISGSATTIASFSTFGWNQGDTLKGAIIGSTLYAYKNGALIGSITDPAPITNYGYPGVVLYNGGSISSWIGDTIVTGTCGSSDNLSLTSAPASNLCSVGTASSVSGTGPWNWSCAGSGGGSTANCAALLQTSGSCGSSNNQSFTSAPTTGFCNSGTATAVTGAGPWNWTCVGANGGATANCSALLPGSGVCGSSNNQSLASAPTTGFCNSGTATAVTGAGPWNWTCVGANGGTTASCSALKPGSGVCGSSNNQSFTSAPTTGFCNSGTATAVTGAGPWNWTCTGANGGNTATCSALLSVNGVCGSSNGAIFTGAPSTNLCNSGTASSITGSGPWGWTCNGSNGGASSTCSAQTSSNVTAATTPDGIVFPAPGKTKPDMSDVMAILKFADGISTPTAAELSHADVAPLGSDGKPHGDGIINALDVIVVLRMIVGLI
jgi:hypothetical protein